MKLRVGYLICGITTGLIILIGFIWTQPDGLLHIVFCNVGQGDSAYVRFPDGRDMLVDGGPDNGLALTCLGRHMPFWDRHINIVVMSHPQADHMGGLVEVFKRFSVDYFVRSDADNNTDIYKSLLTAVNERHVPVRYVTAGDQIAIGSTSLLMIWPSFEQLARAKPTAETVAHVGVAVGNLNDDCLVFVLRYGNFDAVFPGDADRDVEANYTGLQVFHNPVEILKVPHHGSKTGMNLAFIDWLKPQLAVISVGKNTYGQPAKEAVDMLQNVGSRVLRTDQKGDIEVTSDGIRWSVKTEK